MDLAAGVLLAIWALHALVELVALIARRFLDRQKTLLEREIAAEKQRFDCLSGQLEQIRGQEISDEDLASAQWSMMWGGLEHAHGKHRETH